MTDIAQVTRTWDELVDAGRRVLSNAAWELGDLACEVEIGYGDKSLQRFAEELEVKYDYLRQLRWVSSRYPQELFVRTNSSWNVYHTLAGQEDRFELISSRRWTVTQARELVSHRREIAQARQAQLEASARSLSEQLAEVKQTVSDAAQATKPLLAQLYEQVKAGVTKSDHASVLRWAHEQGEHDGVKIDGCAECQAAHAANAPVKLYMTFPEVNHDITKLVTYVQDSAAVLSDHDRKIIMASIAEMRGALDLMESMAVNGGVTDAALEKLLEQLDEGETQ